MSYIRITGTEPAYRWFTDHVKAGKKAHRTIKGYIYPGIGPAFTQQYGSNCVMLARGENIVHSLVVESDDLLSGASYVRIGDKVHIRDLKKEKLPQLLPGLFEPPSLREGRDRGASAPEA